MSNYVMWSLIAGFFLPPVEAFLQQTYWPEWLRAIVNFLVCCGVAIGVVAWQTPDVNWHDWIRSTLLVLVTAISIYKGLWKPTKIAPVVEAKTTVRPTGTP